MNGTVAVLTYCCEVPIAPASAPYVPLLEMTPHNLAKNGYLSLTALITTDRAEISQTADGKRRDATP